MKEQAKEYLLQQHEHSPGSVDFLRLRQGSTLLGPPGPASPEEEMLSGEVAMVLLDSGEIAHTPVECLEPRNKKVRKKRRTHVLQFPKPQELKVLVSQAKRR